MQVQAINRLKCVSIKSNYLWCKVDRKAKLFDPPQQIVPPGAMYEESNRAFQDRREPTTAEMIAIEMCKTDRPDIEG